MTASNKSIYTPFRVLSRHVIEFKSLQTNQSYAKMTIWSCLNSVSISHTSFKSHFRINNLISYQFILCISFPLCLTLSFTQFVDSLSVVTSLPQVHQPGLSNGTMSFSPSLVLGSQHNQWHHIFFPEHGPRLATPLFLLLSNKVMNPSL